MLRSRRVTRERTGCFEAGSWREEGRERLSSSSSVFSSLRYFSRGLAEANMSSYLVVKSVRTGADPDETTGSAHKFE
jgi:hypothetical protein